jgi:hypothetical protein
LDHETRSSILGAREADYEQLTKKNVGVFRQRINEPAMKLVGMKTLAIKPLPENDFGGLQLQSRNQPSLNHSYA